MPEVQAADLRHPTSAGESRRADGAPAVRPHIRSNTPDGRKLCRAPGFRAPPETRCRRFRLPCRCSS